MADYILSNTAKENLLEIYKFGCKQFGESQAEKYFNSLYDFFELITQNPLLFESVDFIKKGYRRGVCGIHSVYYRVNGELIEIMAILGRQDFSSKF
jgi:toxin ParE1/3/4